METVNASHTTCSAKETEALGRDLATRLADGDVVLLFGELGTGKTTLVRGLAAGLGLDPRRVHSPSFIMVNRYQGARPLFHVDLYRVQPGEDLSDLALPDLFSGQAIAVVEWAERLLPGARPRPRWEIHLGHAGDNVRRIDIRRVAEDAPESG